MCPFKAMCPRSTPWQPARCYLQFAGLGAAKSYVTSGQLRALAVTSATREPALPDIPTVGEFVPGYEMSGWLGIGAPRNIRAEIVERLSKEITAGLSDPVVPARLAHSNHVPMPMKSAEFAKFVADETEKLGKCQRLISQLLPLHNRITDFCRQTANTLALSPPSTLDFAQTMNHNSLT